MEVATAEKARSTNQSESNYELLKTLSAKLVADSFLMHHKADRRETFRAKLSESLEVESEEWMFLLAGLRETGLSYKDTERGPKVWMKQPGLSNPDPDVFASRAQGALFHSDEKALETMTERGREILDKPEQKTEMQGWLANMEIAIHSS